MASFLALHRGVGHFNMFNHELKDSFLCLQKLTRLVNVCYLYTLREFISPLLFFVIPLRDVSLKLNNFTGPLG